MEIPKCPIHNVQVILRVARFGRFKGKNFYGCKLYPRCPRIIDYDNWLLKNKEKEQYNVQNFTDKNYQDNKPKEKLISKEPVIIKNPQVCPKRNSTEITYTALSGNRICAECGFHYHDIKRKSEEREPVNYQLYISATYGH